MTAGAEAGTLYAPLSLSLSLSLSYPRDPLPLVLRRLPPAAWQRRVFEGEKVRREAGGDGEHVLFCAHYKVRHACLYST